MKKIKLFLGCFIAMTLLYACFDDEGNYDLSELATVGIQLSYTQPSIGEEYVIDPVIDTRGWIPLNLAIRGYVTYRIRGVILSAGKKC